MPFSIRFRNKTTTGNMMYRRSAGSNQKDKKRGREEGKRQAARDRTRVGGREEGGDWDTVSDDT